MQDHLARMEALLMHHLGIRPHVPPTPLPPSSLAIERSGHQHDDICDGAYVVDTQHLTTDRSFLGPHLPSQSALLDDHQPAHLTDPRRELFEDRQQLLDDDKEFMLQLMSPTRPPPRQE
ncbi:hypothetical protein Scep_026741 [Stephania cephalantha]|uniref:Uncharacterized protein n=1 Tax=Stephania cephalantha TaxID=152367 RepID=A0AAP0ENX7_9MAGN